MAASAEASAPVVAVSEASVPVTPAPSSAQVAWHQQAVFVVPREAIAAAAAAEAWGAVAALVRINALACCKSAQHGWLGGAFSCCELLVHLHLRCPELEPEHVVLSKGHAAAMQCVWAYYNYVSLTLSLQLLYWVAKLTFFTTKIIIR